MNEHTRLFLTKGAGADPACRLCYARNALLHMDELEQENEWLHEEVFRQEKVIGGLEKQLDTTKKECDDYRKRLEQLLHRKDGRDKKVGSVPAFVKPNTTKKRRKRPGAKPGHPGFSRRKPAMVNEVVEVNPVRCPECNSLLKEIKGSKLEDHLVEDIVPGTVKVTNYRHHRKYCPTCRRVVRVRHRAEVPNGRLGPGVISRTARLKFENRIPWRMIPEILHISYGLSVTESALVQRLEHLSRKFEGVYSLIRERLRTSSFLHADETGWRIDGQNGWLWVFANKDDAFYKIDRSRSSAVVEAVLGKKYDSVLITDFYSAYNPIQCLKQKCLVHFQKELHGTEDSQVNDAIFLRFHKRFDDLVKQGKSLKEKKSILSKKRYKMGCQRIENKLDNLSRYEFPEKTLGNRLVGRINRHRDAMLTFLYHDDVDYHNNLAERQLRPGVVIRKISYGSRSEKGARMHEIIMTVLQTCKLQGTDFDKVCRAALLGEPTNKELLDLIYNNDDQRSKAKTDKPP